MAGKFSTKGVSRSSKIEANKYKFQDQETQAQRDADGTEKTAQGHFSGRTRGKVNGKTAGTVYQANKMKEMDDAGIGVTHAYEGQKEPNENIKAKTIKRELDTNTYVTDISSPNQLHQFASYNTIFTLSVLSTAELENTKTLLTAQPHDIIIRSGGIGPNANQDEGNMNATNRKTIHGSGPMGYGGNKRRAKTLEKSRDEFRKNKDMYFKNVTMNNVPGLNEKRRLTSVTQVNMEIVEPWGISLIERLRAGAANNNFLDHLDAPYMLTVEFIGWDEKGRAFTNFDNNTTKRVIPVKLTNMQMDVNQAGTIYQVTAIPYNEFAYVNRYNYPRTAGTIEPKGKSLADIAAALEEVLNKQNQDEKKDHLVEEPDEYKISIDQAFKPDQTMINTQAIRSSPMYVNNVKEADNLGSSVHGDGSMERKPIGGGEFKVINGEEVIVQSATESRWGKGFTSNYKVTKKLEYMKIDSSSSITTILENIMKSHPDMTADKTKEWREKVTKTLTDTAETASNTRNDIDNRASGDDMYFTYFRIRSSVVPSGRFDEKRQKNQKTIKFVVEPYKIHAYSLAIAGVSTGKNMKAFVYKTYNHMFTGENIDVLDIDIKYKVAYFTSVLKDVAGDTEGQNKIEKNEKTHNAGNVKSDGKIDEPLGLTSEVGIAKSAGPASTDTKYTHFDQFLDALTHPMADMVNIRLEILGDPAWLGQSQFIPAVPLFIKPGVSTDEDIKYWRGDVSAIWNDTYKCFNADIAEPIVMFNFRMPTDINDRTGTYEIAQQQQGTFSGLYKVVQVEHSWDGGNYKNTLSLVRFNNQGVYISKPESMVTVENINGTTEIMTSEQLRNADRKGSYESEFSFLGSVRDNIKRKVDNIVGSNGITSKASKAKNFSRSPHTRGGTGHATGPQNFVDRSKRFDPSQGSTGRKFLPSQGNVRRNVSVYNQAAVNQGIQSNEADR